MIKVLVTGGAGFVGSHLVDRLLGQDKEVWVLDDLSTGQLGNIDQLKQDANFHFVKGSVLDEELVNELVDQTDVVYHLAASVGVKLIVERLVSSIINNVRGCEVVLAAAAKRGRKVLLTSTSEVYGRGHGDVFRETDDLAMGPTTVSRWSYACSKAMDEYLAMAYYQEQGLPVTVVRLFNTVGDRQSDAYGMVVPTFVGQALRSESLTIHGNGRQSRCFAYVGDVVVALTSLMESAATNGEIYNVGSEESVTIEELADRVIEVTGSKSAKKFVPYEEAYREGFEDVDRRVPDIAKISALGWATEYNLNDIIRKVMDSLSTQLPTKKRHRAEVEK